MNTIPLLSPDEAEEMLSRVNCLTFIDGKATARGKAKQAKFNQQAERQSDDYAELAKLVINRIRNCREIQDRAFPQAFTKPLFSRYATGDRYGLHVDRAQMGSTHSVRTDLSFTLFLSPPDKYEGGELEIAEVGHLRRIKPVAGYLALYETGPLHQVLPVKSGERVAAVGWIQSWIPDPQYRALMTKLRLVQSGVDAAQVSPMLKLACMEATESLIRYGSR